MAEPTPKPRRGCLFYALIGGAILILFLVGGGLIGFHYAKKMINDFTDAQPMPLPQVQMPRSEIDKLEQRIDTFRQAIRAGKPTEPLALSADEINALIQTDPDFSPLKGKLFVTLQGDKVSGQLSVPMELVGLHMFKGRYLNGTGLFSLSLHNGRLRLFVMKLVVKQRQVPEVYMEQIRKYNWADNFNGNPRAAAALEALKEIKVQDSKLIVVPK
jgi:hypothetical protein